jgi:hypothetical protein
MTRCTKPIWLVVITTPDGRGQTTERVAAYDLEEALAYYTEEAIKRVISTKKTYFKITYHY